MTKETKPDETKKCLQAPLQYMVIYSDVDNGQGNGENNGEKLRCQNPMRQRRVALDVDFDNGENDKI